MLLHSLGADGRMWDACLVGLGAAQHVVVPDTRGHGRSGPSSTASVDHWVGDLDQVLDSAGVRGVVLVGVSLGGIQALAYAAAHPARVLGLVVADSFAALEPEMASAKIADLTTACPGQTMAEVAEQYVADTFMRPSPEGAEAVRDAIAGMDADSYVAAVAACFGAQIARPARGRKAPDAGPVGRPRHEDTQRTVRAASPPGVPDAAFGVVPDAGHLSNVDNPAWFSQELLRFLSEISPPAAGTYGEGDSIDG